MTKPRRSPTSPYLLRRLRSYEEVRADRQAGERGAATDGGQDARLDRPEGRPDGELAGKG